ncbi:CIC11C00000004446 [Sungouiella intermedia]|uniref:Mediator of RNA polymerase II transcription subunit 17 n=1 Tax=Sungouiella intermedia TaxID=45354 RepID=A0A1L0C557_9ASCO|nr:CIC11C00000004446 [[Candida] intermedia]
MSETDKVRFHLDRNLSGVTQDPFLQDEESIPIADLIPQILHERQSFLNITEEHLQDEINQGDIDREEEDDESQLHNAKEVDEDTESAYQAFQKRKFELLGNINSAMNETSLSLDFVSLLMSAVKPNVAKTTISPHLTKNVPLGSLSSDRLTMDEDSQDKAKGAKRDNPESIGLGWKYQSLTHITGLFKNAGAQLREQVDIEHRYWNMINKVLGHGEVLFKVRDPKTGARAIGVKYGYGDSGSNYYDKGLAVLRKDEQTGDVTFSPIMTGNHKISQKSNKYTRIKVLSKIDDDFMLTGQSLFDKDAIADKSEFKVINDIEKARYFLFEDDLFYHLIREAKNLINYNVSIISNRIIIEIFDQIIEIESVVYDEDNEEELNNTYQNINKESSKNNDKAQAIYIFLKLMLCCYYDYNLELKQKIPTSFTKWKQSNSHPLMLRPLIGHMRHEINVHRMNIILNNVCKALDATKLSYEIAEEKYVNLHTEKLTNPFRKAVTKPLSKFKVILQKLSTKEYLNVEVEVTSSDIFVNLVIVLTISKYNNIEDLKQNQQGSNVLLLKFTDLMDIEESLNWSILNFLQK